MSVIQETTNWRPQTLRAYESIGSIGAKYCYLNRVKPKEFYSLIVDLMDGNSSNYRGGLTFDNINFDFEKLSKLFCEPLSIVKKLSLNVINDLPKLSSQTGFTLSYRKDFSYCPICLAHGYHSPLHQIVSVSNCFIHHEVLINVVNLNKSIKNLGDDVKFINHLTNIWFSKAGVWESSKLFDWTLLDNNLIEKHANSFFSALLDTEKMLTSTSRIIGTNSNSNLYLQIFAAGNLNKIFDNTYQKTNMSFSEPLHFECTEVIAKTLLNMSSEKFHLFMYAQQITSTDSCISKWKKTLDNMLGDLLAHHGNCLDEFKCSFEKLEKLRVAWCGNHSYVHPPYDMQNYNMVPCPRIVSLNLYHLFVDLEDSLILKEQVEFGSCYYRNLIYKFKDMDDLESLVGSNLAEYWLGMVSLNNNQLMKKILPNLSMDYENQASLRKVMVYKPLGLLADIVEVLLYETVQAWAWALYETEKNRSIFSKDTDASEFLKNKILKTSPSAILERTENGILLRIGKMVPEGLPNWDPVSLSLRKHNKEVRMKSKELKTIFDQILVQRMKHVNLMENVKNYRLTHRH